MVGNYLTGNYCKKLLKILIVVSCGKDLTESAEFVSVVIP